MRTTKQDSALKEPKGAVDRTVFTMAPALSDQDLITVASVLAKKPTNEGKLAKRIFDITLATFMLILMFPVMLITALAVAITSPGPILFKQERVGCRGRSFACLKFRSMRVDAENRLISLLKERPELLREWECNQKLQRDPRITRLGAFLRISSIDELPQLINVIRGDMSLVGPRPIVPSEVPKYGRHILSYFAVKPGLTGIWQVTGRNNSTYARRVAADVIYARSHSLWLDMKIIALTVPAVLTGRGSC